MTRAVYSILLLLLPLCTIAQDTTKSQQDDKKLIRSLLKERKDRFAQYTDHLDDKSGIFGTQTKKDLRQLNEVLKDIVRTDNNIIMELDRLLDQRKFESFRSDYETKRAGQELVSLQQNNERLMAANDTLVKQVEILKGSGATMESHGSCTIYIFLTYFFGAALVFLLLLQRKKPVTK